MPSAGYKISTLLPAFLSFHKHKVTTQTFIILIQLENFQYCDNCCYQPFTSLK